MAYGRSDDDYGFGDWAETGSLQHYHQHENYYYDSRKIAVVQNEHTPRYASLQWPVRPRRNVQTSRQARVVPTAAVRGTPVATALEEDFKDSRVFPICDCCPEQPREVAAFLNGDSKDFRTRNASKEACPKVRSPAPLPGEKKKTNSFRFPDPPKARRNLRKVAPASPATPKGKPGLQRIEVRDFRFDKRTSSATSGLGDLKEEELFAGQDDLDYVSLAPPGGLSDSGCCLDEGNYAYAYSHEVALYGGRLSDR